MEFLGETLRAALNDLASVAPDWLLEQVSADWFGLTEPIHQSSGRKGLLPDEYLVDTSYVDAELLLDSRTTYKVDLIGPVPPNPSWQSKDEQAYDLSWFAIDWGNQRVTCPQGKQSTRWHLRQTPEGTPMIDVKFRHADCAACPQGARCTKSKGGRPGGLNFRPKEQYQILQAARQRQGTDAFKALYQKRAGIEGSISQAVQAFGLRRTRYVGPAKTHLQHLATAAAMNLTRLAAWLDSVPKAHTRQSRFLALKPSFRGCRTLLVPKITLPLFRVFGGLEYTMETRPGCP